MILLIHRIVQAFEAVAVSLAQQENFTELEIKNENIAVRIETVSAHIIAILTFMF